MFSIGQSVSQEQHSRAVFTGYSPTLPLGWQSVTIKLTTENWELNKSVNSARVLHHHKIIYSLVILGGRW